LFPQPRDTQRYVLCQHLVDPLSARPRQQFAATSRSIRDLIAHRWWNTRRAREQPASKRIHYMSKLRVLLPLAQDSAFRDRFRQAKREAKLAFANWLKATQNETVDPESIFDSQIKRIHEYKRQLLNARMARESGLAIESAPGTTMKSGGVRWP
jgi:glucan phosphorylase